MSNRVSKFSIVGVDYRYKQGQCDYRPLPSCNCAFLQKNCLRGVFAWIAGEFPDRKKE